METPEKSSAAGSKNSPSTTGLGPDATNAAVPDIKEATVYYTPKFTKKDLADSFKSINIPFITQDEKNDVRSEKGGTSRIKGTYNKQENKDSNGIFYINIDKPSEPNEILIQPWVSLRIKTIYLKVEDLDLKKYLFAKFKEIRNSIQTNIGEFDNSFEGDDWEPNSDSSEEDLAALLIKITNALTLVNPEKRNTFAQKVDDIVVKLNDASLSEGASEDTASKDGESKASKYVDLRF